MSDLKVKLSVEQFRTAATIGLGRAILHLQQTGDIPDKDLLLHLMLHSTAYDSQIEGGRDWYAFQLVQASGQAPSYIQEFWEALKDFPPSDDADEYQRMGIIGYLAEAGEAETDKQLFDRTAANIAVGSRAGVQEVIERNGVSGAEFVIDRYQEIGDWNYIDLYFDIARAFEDSEEIQNLPFVQELVEWGKRKLGSPGSARNQEQVSVTYEDFKNKVNEDPTAMRSGCGRPWSRWFKTASDEEIRQAAEDFMMFAADDYDHILSYISLFAKRAFPLDPAILIDMARQYTDESPWTEAGMIPERMLPFRAFIALSKIRHPDVRAFAIEWIQESRELDNVVGLLGQNYQPGDWNLISSVLHAEHSPETLHGMGMGIRDVFKAHPTKEALPVLQFMIEHGPCSFCRHSFMEGMHQLGGLPELMRVEAPFDSNDDIREWAEGIGAH